MTTHPSTCPKCRISQWAYQTHFLLRPQIRTGLFTHILTLVLLLHYECTSCLLSIFGDRIRSSSLSPHRSTHVSSCDVHLWGTLGDKQHNDNFHTDSDRGGESEYSVFNFAIINSTCSDCAVCDACLQYERNNFKQSS